MTEQEKMELVVVDTSTCTLYDFTASSWRGPRTPEEVLKAAQNSAADDVRRYENILNSGGYDDRKEYWTECLEAAKARTFSTMTYGDFLNAQRERLLSDPMQEITEQQFDDALNVLPPLAWHTRHNVEEFCSREFETGSYTMQYAYSLVQGNTICRCSSGRTRSRSSLMIPKCWIISTPSSTSSKPHTRP